MKWSDGEPVTMDDVTFAVEDVLFDKELTAVFPAWLKAGNSALNNPMSFEVVDDWTFKIKFDQPYGGFPVGQAQEPGGGDQAGDLDPALHAERHR
jgi:peptide/nickel transport system substrate-binding protein